MIDATQEMTRRCYKCAETKPLAKFIRQRDKPNGRGYICNRCKYSYKRRKHRPGFLAKRARIAATWRNKNKKKCQAHAAVSRAIASGALQKGPCEVCGSSRAGAHHDDYDQPLQVRWLCSVHHSEWHEKNGEGQNAR